MKLLRALTTLTVALSATIAPLAMAGADAAVKKSTKRTGPTTFSIVSFNTEYPQPNAAALTDVGFEALAAAAPGHLATVREHVFDPLSDTQVLALSEALGAILTRVDPMGDAPTDRRFTS